MNTSQALQVSPEDRAAVIARIRSCLDGTFMVEAETCLRCARRVAIRWRNLERAPEKDEKVAMGTIADAQVAMCSKISGGCGYYASPKFTGLSGSWLCGSARVDFVDGKPYAKREVPQAFTSMQRERLRKQLSELEAA